MRKYKRSDHGKKLKSDDVNQINEMGKSFSEMLSNPQLIPPNIDELAEKDTERRTKEQFERMLSGKMDDPELDYGDGEQSLMTDPIKVQVLMCVWGKNGDYNPFENPLFSDWCRACCYGDVEQIKKHLAVSGPKILDRRESILRNAGINHVIAGAKNIVQVLKTNPNADPIECLHVLIKAGANVNSKDISGSTPIHHCTLANASDLTLEMAKILINAGADVNLPNRMGNTPIFEPTMTGKIKTVKFLLRNGADIDVKGTCGLKIQQMLANCQLDMQQLYVDHMANMGAKQKQTLKLEGKYKVCAVCNKSSKLSRCIACYNVWYCGKECQKGDWKIHKEDCKKVSEEFMEVTFMTTGVKPTYHSKTLKLSTKNFALNPTKFNFILKIQLLAPSTEMYLMAYNEDRSVHGGIHPTQPIYKHLHKAISEEGVAGKIKGYFFAVYKGGQLKINPFKIQAPQSW